MLVTTYSESPCGACAMLYGATCCSRKAGDGQRLPMSYNDALKVSRWACKPGIDGVVVMPADQKDISDQLGDDFGSLVVGGHAIYLPLTTGGACSYLGPRGCSIPTAKPVTCAMFPFKPSPGGTPSLAFVRAPGYCYGQDIGQDDYADTMGIFGETPATLEIKNQRWKTNLRNHATMFSHWLKNHGF